MAQIREITDKASVGTCFNKGLDIYKKNFAAIFVGSLLAGLVALATCGICAAPMGCGLMAMILAAMRGGQKPQIGDVFKKFDKFLPGFLAILALGLVNFIVSSILALVPIVGWLAGFVWAFAIAAIMQWALLLVVDQNATAGEAITVPLKQVGNDKFWSVIIVVFVANLIAAAGAIACGIGMFFTIPLASCIIVAAYEEAIGSQPAAQEPTAAQIEG